MREILTLEKLILQFFVCRIFTYIFRLSSHPSSVVFDSFALDEKLKCIKIIRQIGARELT